MYCFEEITYLLAKNEIGKAIKRLEERIYEYQELKEYWVILVSNSAFLVRTEINFNNGNIDWEKYNVSNSRIIVTITELAEVICKYIEKNKMVTEEHKLMNRNLILSKEQKYILEDEKAWIDNKISSTRKQHIYIKSLLKKYDDFFFEYFFNDNKNEKFWQKWLDEYKNEWLNKNLFMKFNLLDTNVEYQTDTILERKEQIIRKLDLSIRVKLSEGAGKKRWRERLVCLLEIIELLEGINSADIAYLNVISSQEKHMKKRMNDTFSYLEYSLGSIKEKMTELFKEMQRAL